jgi:hypothetical protein
MYDVYWLACWILLWGSKYLEYIQKSELNILHDEQRNKYWMKSNYELNNNNWEKAIINSRNKSRVSFKKS